jgi:hypothetical protein
VKGAACKGMIPQEHGGWQTLYNISCRAEAQQASAPVVGASHVKKPSRIVKAQCCEALHAVTSMQTHYEPSFCRFIPADWSRPTKTAYTYCMKPGDVCRFCAKGCAPASPFRNTKTHGRFAAQSLWGRALFLRPGLSLVWSL